MVADDRCRATLPAKFRSSQLTSCPARQADHEIYPAAVQQENYQLSSRRQENIVYSIMMPASPVNFPAVEMLLCDMCDSAFTSVAGLRGHRDRVHFHKTSYKCHICNKGFTMRGHYIGHMNMHNKVKAFKCAHCPRAFAHRTSLRTHLRNSPCGMQTSSALNTS